MKHALLLAALFLGACETAGNVTREQVSQINPGMSAAQVRTALGEPGNRSFRGSAEAWQYCRDAFYRDEYQTVWLVEGAVVSLTTYTLSPEGSCAAYYRAIDWGQAPPDVRIRLE